MAVIVLLVIVSWAVSIAIGRLLGRWKGMQYAGLMLPLCAGFAGLLVLVLEILVPPARRARALR